MCDFCEALLDKNKKIIWRMRSTFSDDNICEYVNDLDCGVCSGCETYFKITGYLVKKDMHVSVEYFQKLRDKNDNYVLIRPFSEGLQWNYCPICGKRISENLIDISEEYSIEINEV